MDDLKTRIGYLRGMADGLAIGEDTKEGKIISQMIVVLDEIVQTIEELQEDSDELFSYVESIDEDLTELEETFLDELEDDHEEDDEQGYNGHENQEVKLLEDVDDDDFDVSFSVECPECREEVAIDEDILEEEGSLEVLCPSCGRVVFINDEDWEEELEEGEDEDEGEGEKE